MQKITSNILIVATVIAMLPLQGFALNEQTGSTNTGRTQTNVGNDFQTGNKEDGKKEKVKKFNNDAERLEFIKNKIKNIRKKDLGNTFTEKDPTIRAKKVRTLTESFYDRKKNKKEIIVTSTGGLESVQSYLTNIDDTTAIKSLGGDMYSVVFQNGKNLDTTYFSDIDTGSIPEKLFDFPIVQPVLITSEAILSPYLNGEGVSKLWGMIKMETTNYQNGLSFLPSTTIAIIDTGIDRTHKDLTKNTWVNTKEISGNNIDDDGNGYIDDVNGYDFVNKDSDPTDDHGHGTHVSGSAAGSVNGEGVFGVNSNAKLVGLKVLSAAGNGSSYDVYKAIYYAADNGIKVINMSLGGGGNPATDPVCSAINYAKSKGVITVVAAGNSNIDANSQVPAGCANAITVGAVDSTLNKASFSNYGAKVDTAAPGVGVYSSTRGNTYASWAGTSMATPYVAGLVSAIKTYRPAMNVDDIKVLFKNVALTESVTSSVNIGRFPNMAKIFVNLGIKSDSELSAPPPTTGTGTTGTGVISPPPSTGTGTTGTGVITPPRDTSPPQTISLAVSLTTQTGTTLSVSISEAGTGYYLVLPASSIAPSNTTVVAGNNFIRLNANVVTITKIGGLIANTSYKLYFVAKDIAGNLQGTVSTVAFTTLTTPIVVTPPTGNIAPTLTYTSRLVSKNTYELTIVGKDVDGTIKKYEMYFGGRVISTNPKITVRIYGGNITLYAKVYDNLGASATSPKIILEYKR